MSAEQRLAYTGELLDAVWMHGRNANDPGVISELAHRVGLNGPESVLRATTDQDCKQRLQLQTERAVAAGVFGVPSFSVDGELFWGSEQETMSHIEAAVLGRSVVDKAMLEQWRNIESGATRKR
jgi:2-hydroxychromene-2-carboxylate isomerase